MWYGGLFIFFLRVLCVTCCVCVITPAPTTNNTEYKFHHIQHFFCLLACFGIHAESRYYVYLFCTRYSFFLNARHLFCLSQKEKTFDGVAKQEGLLQIEIQREKACERERITVEAGAIFL